MKRRSALVAHDRTFSVVLEPQPEGGFTVLVPAFPEIITEGDTEEEALAMEQDAIRLVLEDRAARGEDIPGDSDTSIREVKVLLRHDRAVAVAEISGGHPRTGARGFFSLPNLGQPLPARPSRWA